MRAKIYIFIVHCLILVSFVYCQKVLFDDLHAPHPYDEWQDWIDTLESHGITVKLTTNVGITLDTLLKFDVVWIIHPNAYYYTSVYDFFDTVKQYWKYNNKKIVFWDGTDRPPSPFAVFFNPYVAIGDTIPRSIIISRRGAITYFNFFGLTLGFDSTKWDDIPVSLECGNNAYPYIFADSGREYPIAAIIYPYVENGNCNYMLIGTGMHYYEYSDRPRYNIPFSWYYPGRNMLFVAASVPGYELHPCSVPEPYQISVTSIPSCANPGDAVRICGRNLWRGKTESLGGDIEIYIGATERVPQEYDTIVIPICYSPDSTWLEFIMPDLPPGTYPIRLGHKAITFYAGDIMVPCPHRCERFPNPITPNFDAINDFAQFEFDGIFVKPARIHIFDIHGHEIRTIDVPAGLSAKQHARWDGTDDGGNPVPEGVYIYTIEVAGEVVCEGTITVAR